MYPLKNWSGLRQGYKFGQPTFYSNFHLGTDKLIPTGTPVYAPFTGRSDVSVGSEGGNTVTFYPDGMPYVFRFLHNSKTYSGRFSAGQIIAISGNTGSSTAPHSHIDISKNKVDIYNHNNFVNPDTFNWEQQGATKMTLKTMPTTMFNKMHDMGGNFYEGYTEKEKPNSHQEWINAYTKDGDKSVDWVVNKMWLHEGLKKLRYDQREAFAYVPTLKKKITDLTNDLKECKASGGSSVDKAAIKKHAEEIIKLAK